MFGLNVAKRVGVGKEAKERSNKRQRAIMHISESQNRVYGGCDLGACNENGIRKIWSDLDKCVQIGNIR